MLGLFNRNKRSDELEVTVSSRTVLRVVLLVLGSFLLFVAVRKASHAFILILIAFFLALAFNAPVHWLSQKLPSKSRTLATSMSFAFLVLLLAGFVASVAPPLVRQTGNFIKAAPGLVQDLRSQDSTAGHFIREHHLQSQVDKFSSQLSDRLQNLTGSAVDTFTRVTSSIFSMLTVLVFAFLMLIEGPKWIDIGQRLLPEGKRKHTEKVATDMYRVVKGYVNGQLILAAIASVFIFVPLVILGISYPLALLVIVFICGLIPLVGHTLGAIIVTIVALFHSIPAAIIILVYYITYQQIENYLMQPRIQANTTNMSPLLVFLAVIIGVNFDGLLGGLLAIPIAGCIRIAILDYIERRNLLDPPITKKALEEEA
jgi:predicted PurR-regulated permease PerM